MRSSAFMTITELFTRAGLEDFLSSHLSTVGDEVSHVCYDSREIKPGAVFVAIKGIKSDGLNYVGEALNRGAVAIVSEESRPKALNVPWIKVANVRKILAKLSATFYRDPSHELLIIGTTGTNGKTTTTYLVEQVLESSGMSCGRISSVTHRLSNQEQDAIHTTPESNDLQRLLREMVDLKCNACAMEVSSHALALSRVEAVKFSAVAFTNLTRDHLDFHGDMSSYFSVKRRLFKMISEEVPAVINVDDPYGKQLMSDVNSPVTYGINTSADVMPEQMELSSSGIELEVKTPRGPLQISSNLLGQGNTYNILAAIALGFSLGLPFPAIRKGIMGVKSVPGRMQVVSVAKDAVQVLVDFAHTDDALRSLLETARKLTDGRLITVFGCGGDRDTSKRPLMGAVAGRLSDLVILTSDNPRSEDPAHIAKEVERGLSACSIPWLIVLSRREAIQQSIQEAKTGDLVVIAGKGHERHQIIGEKFMPFDDASVAREALALRRSGVQAG